MSYPYKNQHPSPRGEGSQDTSRSTSTARQSAYRPSRMQIGFLAPDQQETRGHGQLYEATRVVAPSQHQSSRMHTGYLDPPPAQRNQLEPTRTAGRTIIVRPGEPHHFGNRMDRSHGKFICTLCRCRNPNSHGDAYTMLDSPRGNDINGKAIDWQTAKLRMLDYYGKDQISHEEEIMSIPHIFDAITTAMMMEGERELQQCVGAGGEVHVNTTTNNVNWHNEDGHARSHVTEGGLRTRIDRGGWNAPPQR